jgi:hypothetical protein
MEMVPDLGNPSAMLVAMKQSPITRDPKHTAFVLVFIDPPVIINVVAAGCRITVNQETHPSAHSFNELTD